MSLGYRRAVLGFVRWSLVLCGASLLISEVFGDLEDEQ